MTNVAATAIGLERVQFSIGRAFSMTFGVLGRNFGPMALIALIVTAIESGIDYLLSGDPMGGESSGSSFLSVLTYALITAPVTYATLQDLRGRHVNTSGMISGGFSRIGRVIGASIVVGLVAFVPAAIGGVLWVTNEAVGMVAGFATATLLLYLFVLWFVLIPVLVVEEVRFFAGFRRAAELSSGRRWSILGLLLVYGVLVVSVGAVMLGIGAMAASVPFLAAVIMVPLLALYSIVGAILPAVVYYLLRAEREGVGIEEIARVFD